MQSNLYNRPGKKLQGTLFQNPILNGLTKSSPTIIVSMYVPVILFMLVYSVVEFGMSVGVVLGIFLGGILFWTLAEYFLHKYVFHFENDSAWGRRFHFLIHGYHHEYPRDKEHLFMPPLPSVILAVFFFSLFYVIMQAYAFSFFPGFISGYLGYALMHYSMHTISNPPKFLRGLWRNHQMHHHKHPDKAFGVSSPLWDYVFGTVPQEKQSSSTSK